MCNNVLMTRDEAIRLVQRFVEERLPQERWYVCAKEHVKAIVFYGSRAKEANRSDSDVDIMIVLPLEIEKRCTSGEYNIPYDGWKMNVVLRSIEKIRQIAQAGTDEFQAEIFRKSEIIWESDSEARELINKITSAQGDAD